jgi:hypothetical protein
MSTFWTVRGVAGLSVAITLSSAATIAGRSHDAICAAVGVVSSTTSLSG